MPTQFDPSARRIILDTAAITAAQVWTDWVNWSALADNSKWPTAISQVGGDDLGSGLSIPIYLFLLNGWRVRPMEADHNLVITGNLFVEGGGVPVVNTLGAFNVAVQYTVPVQAQGIATGGSGGLTTQQATMLVELWQRLGLDPAAPLIATASAITAGGDIEIALTGDGTTSSTATRQ